MKDDVIIIQITGIDEDGHIMGLGSDGVVYMDDHANNSTGWVVYVPLNFK